MTPLPDNLLESLAAEAVSEGLADALFTTLSTPIGRLLVVEGRHGVVSLGFEAGDHDRVLRDVAAALGPRILRSHKELAQTSDTISAYLEGDSEDLDIPVDFALVRSDFRRRVLEHLHTDVPRGRTVSYGALAASAGNPKAARAAGSACATNPIPLIVPCHRVLPGTGRVGNYGLGGPEIKKRLLRLEGALPPELPSVQA
jgi:methylated-DNA-[protein]-cysteine S-methyltransferase